MIQRNSERRLQWPALILVVLSLPLLYVLSIGPANGLLLTHRISRATTNRVYAPLIWIADSSNTAEGALDWYCDLFTPNRNPTHPFWARPIIPVDA
jgi:hypothetical protein